MPPITRWIGLLMLLACPAVLAGPSYQPSDVSFDRAPFPVSRASYSEGSSPGVESWPKKTPTPARTSDLPRADQAVPLNPEGHRVPLSLSPPNQRSGSSIMSSPGGFSSTVTIVSSLAIVLGLFLLVAWFMRRTQPGVSAHLPGEVIEMLGRMPLAGRQQLHLLRCGNRLLLVSVTPTGAETLTEITDQAEVNRLIELCHRNQPGSATAVFRQVFSQFANSTRGDETFEPEHASLEDRDV